MPYPRLEIAVLGIVPEKFTLGELRALCEDLLGDRLEKASFRRRIAANDVVEPVEGEMRGGANRPAQVYRLRRRAGDRRHRWGRQAPLWPR